MELKCVILLSLLFGCVVPGLAGDCEDGWFLVQDRCYTVIPMPNMFDAAGALCKSSSFNGTMAMFETKKEKDAVVAHMRGTYSLIFTGQNFWVGARGGKSVFVWNSGVPVSYVDYVDGIGQGVGCLAFGTATLEKYAVLPCTQTNLVLCEKGKIDGGSSAGAAPQVG